MHNLMNTITDYLLIVAILGVIVSFVLVTLSNSGITRKLNDKRKIGKLRAALKKDGIAPGSPEGRAIIGRVMKGQSIYDAKKLINSVAGGGIGDR